MMDIGEVRTFDVKGRVLRISQRGFLENLLRRFNMQGCLNIDSVPSMPEEERGSRTYRETVPRIARLSHVRDIDVQARFMCGSQLPEPIPKLHYGTALAREESTAVHSRNTELGTSAPGEGFGTGYRSFCRCGLGEWPCQMVFAHKICLPAVWFYC